MFTKQVDKNFATFWWLIPSLVKAGLVNNEPWVEKNGKIAEKLFINDKYLNAAAVVLACTDKYAIEYIQQAPIIVLGATKGSTLNKIEDKVNFFKRYQKIFKARPKLRELMDEFSIPYVLRKISDEALSSHYSQRIVKNLKKIDSSTLSQSIPKKVKQQINWLDGLDFWIITTKNRAINHLNDHNSDYHLEWAVKNFSDVNIITSGAIAEIADFALARDRVFNTRLNFNQALKAAREWHIELASKSEEESFLFRYNIGWSEKVDYGKLPTEYNYIDEENEEEYQLIALQSGKDLFEEGKNLHHCVSSYAQDVISGKSRIFSIRKNEIPVATFELKRGFDTIGDTLERAWKLVQLKGLQNADPPKEIHEAVAKFIKQINCPKQ